MAKQKSRTNHAHSEPARQPLGTGRQAGTAGRFWRWPALGALLASAVIIGIYLV
jgi:hypothetical protein